MNDTDFHSLADGTLAGIEQDFEEADQEGTLEVEATDGVVTLSLPDGKQFVISKHAPTRQVWLSSPISGGHHFTYDGDARQWKLQGGRELRAMLESELADLASPKA